MAFEHQSKSSALVKLHPDNPLYQHDEPAVELPSAVSLFLFTPFALPWSALAAASKPAMASASSSTATTPTCGSPAASASLASVGCRTSSACASSSFTASSSSSLSSTTSRPSYSAVACSYPATLPAITPRRLFDSETGEPAAAASPYPAAPALALASRACLPAQASGPAGQLCGCDFDQSTASLPSTASPDEYCTLTDEELEYLQPGAAMISPAPMPHRYGHLEADGFGYGILDSPMAPSQPATDAPPAHGCILGYSLAYVDLGSPALPAQPAAAPPPATATPLPCEGYSARTFVEVDLGSAAPPAQPEWMAADADSPPSYADAGAHAAYAPNALLAYLLAHEPKARDVMLAGRALEPELQAQQAGARDVTVSRAGVGCGVLGGGVAVHTSALRCVQPNMHGFVKLRATW
jgi:hypothetical protein